MKSRLHKIEIQNFKAFRQFCTQRNSFVTHHTTSITGYIHPENSLNKDVPSAIFKKLRFEDYK